MSQIKRIVVEGVPLRMPSFLAAIWPVLPLDEFPNFCGAGKGLGEVLVPDTMFGQSHRHNCFIHDVMYAVLSPTKDNWHLANELMLHNCISTIREKSRFKPLMLMRYHRALNYFFAIESSIGWHSFCKKGITSNNGQENYDLLNDLVLHEKLKRVGVHL